MIVWYYSAGSNTSFRHTLQICERMERLIRHEKAAQRDRRSGEPQHFASSVSIEQSSCL